MAIYLMWSFFLLTLFPESDQSIGRLALTHMENPTALEVNDNGLVQMGMTALGTTFRSSFAFDMLR